MYILNYILNSMCSSLLDDILIFKWFFPDFQLKKKKYIYLCNYIGISFSPSKSILYKFQFYHGWQLIIHNHWLMWQDVLNIITFFTFTKQLWIGWQFTSKSNKFIGNFAKLPFKLINCLKCLFFSFLPSLFGKFVNVPVNVRNWLQFITFTNGVGNFAKLPVNVMNCLNCFIFYKFIKPLW